MKRGEAALNRIEVVFNEPVTIRDPENPAKVGRVRGDIAFEAVTFAYKPEEPVLSGVSASIPSGTVCALVGPSGAGKTTFANLVPRFYDVDSGRVAIDGIDVRQMSLADLRRNIALVSQDPVLFNDTVRNNLLLGRLDATRDEVVRAARDAHADEFIRGFPQGYDTIVGRARRPALRGPEAAPRRRPRVPSQRTDPDPRRGDLGARLAERTDDPGRPAQARRRQDGPHHRPPLQHDPRRLAHPCLRQGSVVATGDHARLYSGNRLYQTLYDRQRTEAV